MSPASEPPPTGSSVNQDAPATHLSQASIKRLFSYLSSSESAVKSSSNPNDSSDNQEDPHTMSSYLATLYKLLRSCTQNAISSSSAIKIDGVVRVLQVALLHRPTLFLHPCANTAIAILLSENSKESSLESMPIFGIAVFHQLLLMASQSAIEPHLDERNQKIGLILSGLFECMIAHDRKLLPPLYKAFLSSMDWVHGHLPHYHQELSPFMGVLCLHSPKSIFPSSRGAFLEIISKALQKLMSSRISLPPLEAVFWPHILSVIKDSGAPRTLDCILVLALSWIKLHGPIHLIGYRIQLFQHLLHILPTSHLLVCDILTASNICTDTKEFTNPCIHIELFSEDLLSALERLAPIVNPDCKVFTTLFHCLQNSSVVKDARSLPRIIQLARNLPDQQQNLFLQSILPLELRKFFRISLCEILNAGIRAFPGCDTKLLNQLQLIQNELCQSDRAWLLTNCELRKAAQSFCSAFATDPDTWHILINCPNTCRLAAIVSKMGFKDLFRDYMSILLCAFLPNSASSLNLVFENSQREIKKWYSTLPLHYQTGPQNGFSSSWKIVCLQCFLTTQDWDKLGNWMWYIASTSVLNSQTCQPAWSLCLAALEYSIVPDSEINRFTNSLILEVKSVTFFLSFTKWVSAAYQSIIAKNEASSLEKSNPLRLFPELNIGSLVSDVLKMTTTELEVVSIVHSMQPLLFRVLLSWQDVDVLFSRFHRDPHRNIRLAFGELLWPCFANFLLRENEKLSSEVILNVDTDAIDLMVEQLVSVFQIGSQEHLETLIINLGKLGRHTCNYERIHEPLLSVLINCLSNDNSIIVSLAFEQLQNIKSQSESDALSPHINLVARSAMVHLVSQPSIVRYLSILLGIPLREFISSTLEWTLPYLVKAENIQVIEEISRICGLDIPDMLIEYAGSILAMLFLQSNESLESCLLFFLSTASSNYGNLSILQVIKSCQLKLLTELVLELGGEYATRAQDVLVLVQERLYPDFESLQLPESYRGQSLIACFLIKDFLGIFSALNRMLNDPKSKPSLCQQIISCFGMLISMVGKPIESFLPQMMSALQTGLSIQRTRNVALQGWSVLVNTLNCDPILDTIVITLLKCFPDMNDWQKDQIYRILEHLIVRAIKGDPNGTSPRLCPELPSDPLFVEINSRIRESKTDISPIEEIGRWISLVPDGNSQVYEYYLSHIKARIERHQEEFRLLLLEKGQSEQSREASYNVTSKLIRWLVKLLSSLNSESVRVLAFDCLGLLGAPDPDLLDVALEGYRNAGSPSSSPKLMSNRELLFEFVSGSRAGFVVLFIEEHLAPLYRACQDSKRQSHLAFTIQELLKCIDCNVSHSSWTKLSPITQFTVQPLLSTKYSMHPLPPKEPRVSSIYKPSCRFSDWMLEFTLELIDREPSADAHRIFSACRNIISDAEIGFAKFILPFVWLESLAHGDATTRDFIIMEFLVVLLDSSNATGDRKHIIEIIFSLLQHLKAWASDSSSNVRDGQSAILISQNVEEALPLQVISKAAMDVQDHPRAFQALEMCIRKSRVLSDANSSNFSSTEITELIEIYADMSEPDGLEGLLGLSQMTLQQQILLNESAGHWSAAQTCYELSIERKSGAFNASSEVKIPLRSVCGLLRCFKELGHFESMLSLLRGYSSSIDVPNHSQSNLSSEEASLKLMNSYGVDAAWRLGKWDSLDYFLSQPCSEVFDTSLGTVVSALHRRSFKDLSERITECKKALITSSSVLHLFDLAPKVAYRQMYGSLSNWAMLCDLESFCELSDKIGDAQTNQQFSMTIEHLDAMLRGWNSRFNVTGTLCNSTKEPLLTLRRTLLEELLADIRKRTSSESTSPVIDRITTEIGKAWLLSAKLARKSGSMQFALSAILHAELYGCAGVHLERAKWHHEQGEVQKAISILSRFLEQSEMVPDTIMLHAKTKLSLMRWTEESSSGNTNFIISKFNDICLLVPEWEKAYFYLGRHYSRLLDADWNLSTAEQQISHAQLSNLLCKNYGKALTLGTRFIYQTMPRLLTVWLDYGQSIEAILESSGSSAESSKDMRITVFHSMNKFMRKLSERLPAYQFLTALPQLISRIGHKNRNVYAVIETILALVLLTYPQQALWQLMSVAKSGSSSLRSSRVATLFSRVRTDRSLAVLRSSISNIDSLIHQIQGLVDQLANLCNHKSSKDVTMLSVNSDFKVLLRMVPLGIILPIQSSLTASLSGITSRNHNPFPSSLPTIYGFKNEIQVMQSLQKPVKLGIIGNDGRCYNFLCKPKDDLRKDTRLMEFNDVVNKLFRKDPEAKKRQLSIRTYAVIPLSENCGIIEWVENTIGFRNILAAKYKEMKRSIMPGPIKKIMDKTTAANCVEVFNRDVLSRFTPVFYKWFIDIFPEPRDWIEARNAYGRSLATMSMVGFVVGLGDRHGENILLDSKSGEVVHVDLNCLFEKGKTFEKPECVPFRLTHNMVDALGLSGVSGIYMKACEVSLAVLRTNRESLISVLETFVHDPLCEWARKGSTDPAAQKTALHIRETINRKLQGYMSLQSALPLSVSGQVAELIREATDLKNLSKMYIGWAPYL